MAVNSQTNFGLKQKAATIIMALGVENSSQIYKYLRDSEIEQLTYEIAIMHNVSAEDAESTLEEFYNLCLAQKFITEGGIEYAKAILEKAMSSTNAANVIERVTKSLSNRAFDFLTKADPKNLLNLIQSEHPQTIALILSYCSPSQASAVLTELPRETQFDVTKRIATMDRTSPEIIKDVERVLEKKLSSSEAVDFTEIGGVKYIAEILNSVDTSTEKYIMEELNKEDAVLADEIRKHMFVFEDVARLDSISIQRFLQDIDTKDLLIALKGSSEEVANSFYSNMSVRMSETMSEDAKYLRGVRLSDVEDSQQKLVALARKLEEAGEIFISRGRKDEIIV